MQNLITIHDQRVQYMHGWLRCHGSTLLLYVLAISRFLYEYMDKEVDIIYLFLNVLSNSRWWLSGPFLADADTLVLFFIQWGSFWEILYAIWNTWIKNNYYNCNSKRTLIEKWTLSIKYQILRILRTCCLVNMQFWSLSRISTFFFDYQEKAHFIVILWNVFDLL